jgi:hypothetical protein
LTNVDSSLHDPAQSRDILRRQQVLNSSVKRELCLRDETAALHICYLCAQLSQFLVLLINDCEKLFEGQVFVRSVRQRFGDSIKKLG